MIKRILTIVLLMIMSVSIAACNINNQENPPANDPPSNDTPVNPDTPNDVELFEIYRDGVMISKIIIPEKATSEESNLANRIKNAIFQKTRQSVEILRDNQVTKVSDGTIIIGKTILTESVKLYENLPVRSGIAKIENGMLVIGFTRQSSATAVANKFVAALVGDYESTVGIPLDFSANHSTLPIVSDIPSLDGTEKYSVGKGSDMTYGSSTPEKFKEFCAELDEIGFVKLYEQESAGNLFATYKGEDIYVYTYYTEYSGKIRVITGPLAEMASVSYDTGAEKTYTPYITSIRQPDNGLGLIIRLPDGRFIIVDGGYKNDDRVYAALRELVPSGKITIAAWFITHPHNDHYRGFTDFITNHSTDSSIVIERLMLNFADPEDFYAVEDGDKTVEWDVNFIYNTIEEYAPDLTITQVHTGQIIDFGDATMEILYTMEDLMPKELPNINDSSMAIRLKMGGSSFMILGDTCYRSGPIMHDMWGEYLKSDMVQIAHHGQWPSVESIYHDIAAEVVIVPAKLSRYKSDISDSRWKEQTTAYLSYAKDLYTACDEPIMIELPYKFKNNKDAMVTAIKNYVPKDGEPLK